MRFKNMLGTVACLLAAALSALAQNGDKSGEVQVGPVPAKKIPPSPFLSPQASMKTFVLPRGFRVELVAAEPLVKDPVAMQFDGDGRLYVVEMSGYMTNPEGIGETEPVGCISVLEDTDGDGRMDKRRVFADKLVMPRAISLVQGGLVVAEPPKLWFYPIKADGTAGERTEVANDYAKENDPTRGKQSNPEHASNGLMWALDNWIYSANHTTRFRVVDGTWKREPTTFRGQWGMSQDDFGRLVYNSNSDQFRTDLVPSAYLQRNPNLRSPVGLNVDPIKNQATYPIRVNPGVNRGYQAGTLRPDGRLAKFTAASGPVVYRGSNFPEEYRGNAFVPEPSANLIKRNILKDENGVVTGKQAWDDREFLASTDERFRPVNLYNGPDGGLYIVDFYRGIIQHRIYLTSYLRKQMESRNMQGPTGNGRIYRVVHRSGAKAAAPKLEKASLGQLVGALSSNNGWTRDTAQRLLVQKQDEDAAPALKKVVTSGSSPLGRLHALWTLDGISQLDEQTLTAAFNDKHPKVRATAIRLSEFFIRAGLKDSYLPWLVKLADDRHGDVQLQLALTLGNIADADALLAMAKIGGQSASNPVIRDALLSGLWKREIEFLQLVATSPDWKQGTEANKAMLAGIARCIMTEAKAPRVGRMFDILVKAEPWQQDMVLNAIAEMVPTAQKGKQAVGFKTVLFTKEPDGFLALEKTAAPAMKGSMAKVSKMITWPGQPGYVPPPVIPPLTAEEQVRFEKGAVLFQASCAACHQLTGLGMDGLAPPLSESEWVNGPAERMVRIILHGARGPFSVRGRSWELEMPGLATLDDEQIAAISTYVRREWDNAGSPVTPAQVKAVRADTASRQEAWTEAELMKLK